MKRSIIHLVLLLAVSTGLALHAGGVNFTLDDVQGKTHSLTDYGNNKAVAVIFVSTRCPVSNAYNERMEALNRKFKSSGVVFLGVNSNKAESVDEIKTHAVENKLSFAILKDPGNKVADQLKASFTPEVYVFNARRELMYHGRIDDSRRAGQVTAKDLDAALSAILAGQPVPLKKTKAFGCSIKRVKK